MSPPARPRCSACELPLRTCLCALVRPAVHRIAIGVLQHPAELRHAKGTLRLLQRCLANCETWVGERWPAPPWRGGETWLLYPGDGDLPPAPATPPQRLLLLDGSWRQSRLLMHRNPWLRELPRYALREPPPSVYGALRKAQAPNQLSSLEAVAQALQELEGGTAAESLRAAMADWLALQAAQRGALPGR